MTATIYSATFTADGQTYQGSITLDKGHSAYRASLGSWESWEPVSKTAIALLTRRMNSAARRRGWVKA